MIKEGGNFADPGESLAMDNKMSVVGDWAPPPDPSPRTFMSNFLKEEFGSKPFYDIWAENGIERSLLNSKEECGKDGFSGFDIESNGWLEPSSFDGQKSSSRGGLSQRIARAGFNAPTINTTSSDVRSPYLTIPAGISPTTLLDSPVFLSNSMVQPSPTTGKFSFMSNGGSLLSISLSDSAVVDKSKEDRPEDVAYGGFAFKPHLNSTPPYFSSLENKGSSAIDHKQPLQSVDLGCQKDVNLHDGVSESSDRKDNADDGTIFPRQTDSFVSNEHSPPLDDRLDGGDTKGEISSGSVAAPAEDGYNWRKYGQKRVKGSVFPRSYYKCTHPNCPVKKKIERSQEGHITEIIYKGAHNHAKPLPNRRSGIPHEVQTDGFEHSGSRADFDDRTLGGDRMDTMSAAEFAGTSTSVQTRDGSRVGSPEAIDVSSNVSNDEEEEDRATHGSVSLGVDAEGDESESKRRKLDACAVEINTGSRGVREPRVVVQTTSEVDILDDGYRWRKYGQKVVKGNPNPRSYYKCTNPGCNVRKHVERASHDLKSVITTYEGKHNHDVPAARNSSHSSSGPAAQPPVLHQRPDPTQDGLMHFDGPPPLGSFNMPGQDQRLGLGPGFSFGMMTNLGMGGLGPMGPVRMTVHGPIHSYMGHHASSGTGAGYMVPKGEPEEEPVSGSGLPISNGMAAYHQLLSRLPLGPQL